MRRFLSTFERSFRRGAQRMFKWLFSRGSGRSIAVQNINRILLVRTDKIGDAVISTCVMQALRERYPDARIGIVLGRRNRVAAPLLPFKDHVIIAGRGAADITTSLRAIRAERYDLAIDMVPGDSITAAIYTAASGARIKIGFEDSASLFYDGVVPHPDASEHQVPRMLRLIAPLGIFVPDDKARPSIVLSEEAIANARHALQNQIASGHPIVMINISGSSPEKFWGTDNFARLARSLRVFKPVLLAAPIDTDLLRAVALKSGAAVIPPHPDLMRFAALLSFADLIISPDTSVVHIASALRKPLVALVSTRPDAPQWSPWRVQHRVVAGATIPEIPYEDTLTAVRELAHELFPAYNLAE